MKRREFVAFLGGAVAWPLAAGAQQQPAAASGGDGPPRSAKFDPRLTPARRDIAAKHLAGVVDAERFVEGKTYEIVAAQAPVRRSPSAAAELLTEALKGERVTIYDITEDGWAWGQLAADGYVGFLPGSALGPAGPATTHKVTALRTLVFPGPSIKLPPIETPPFGSELAIARVEGSFAITAAGGYVPLVHLAPLATMETDFVAVAERFLGAPYLWGGKTSDGLDCSGLLQLALTACNVKCPRDSDMQERALGSALANPGDLAQLRRGDLIFWKGHVAIVRDETTMVHASGHHMAVAIEAIAPAIARIRTDEGLEVTSAHRLPPPA